MSNASRRPEDARKLPRALAVEPVKSPVPRRRDRRFRAEAWWPPRFPHAAKERLVAEKSFGRRSHLRVRLHREYFVSESKEEERRESPSPEPTSATVWDFESAASFSRRAMIPLRIAGPRSHVSVDSAGKPVARIGTRGFAAHSLAGSDGPASASRQASSFVDRATRGEPARVEEEPGTSQEPAVNPSGSPSRSNRGRPRPVQAGEREVGRKGFSSGPTAPVRASFLDPPGDARGARIGGDIPGPQHPRRSGTKEDAETRDGEAEGGCLIAARAEAIVPTRDVSIDPRKQRHVHLFRPGPAGALEIPAGRPRCSRTADGGSIATKRRMVEVVAMRPPDGIRGGRGSKPEELTAVASEGRERAAGAAPAPARRRSARSGFRIRDSIEESRWRRRPARRSGVRLSSMRRIAPASSFPRPASTSVPVIRRIIFQRKCEALHVQEDLLVLFGHPRSASRARESRSGLPGSRRTDEKRGRRRTRPRLPSSYRRRAS